MKKLVWGCVEVKNNTENSRRLWYRWSCHVALAEPVAAIASNKAPVVIYISTSEGSEFVQGLTALKSLPPALIHQFEMK